MGVKEGGRRERRREGRNGGRGGKGKGGEDRRREENTKANSTIGVTVKRMMMIMI